MEAAARRDLTAPLLQASDKTEPESGSINDLHKGIQTKPKHLCKILISVADSIVKQEAEHKCLESRSMNLLRSLKDDDIRGLVLCWTSILCYSYPYGS